MILDPKIYYHFTFTTWLGRHWLVSYSVFTSDVDDKNPFHSVQFDSANTEQLLLEVPGTGTPATKTQALSPEHSLL